MASTKGVSTLVASVLLIAFTVSVAMIVMGWFSSFARTTTENVSGVTQTAIGCSAGIIEFDHIYISNSTNNSQISVINSGQIPLTVNAMIVAINGSTCKTTAGTTVIAGSSGTIPLNVSCPIMNSTTFSSAMLTTNCAGITSRTTRTDIVTFL